jgi:hypothetical protein
MGLSNSEQGDVRKYNSQPVPLLFFVILCYFGGTVGTAQQQASPRVRLALCRVLVVTLRKMSRNDWITGN